MRARPQRTVSLDAPLGRGGMLQRTPQPTSPSRPTQRAGLLSVPSMPTWNGDT